MALITFDKNGHDTFIDFLKAYSILCVLAGHTFSYLDQTGYFLWYGMQVPLFILVQVFHAYKREQCSVSFSKLWRRILLPFIIFQSFAFVAEFTFSGYETKELIYRYLTGGGGVARVHIFHGFIFK